MTELDVDDAEVLMAINEVRARIGWEALSGIPKGDPTNACKCVFGCAWGIECRPVGGEGAAYTKVTFRERIEAAQYGKMAAIGDVLGGEIVGDRVVVAGSHPLMRWMFCFDHEMFPALVHKGKIEGDGFGAEARDYEGRMVPVLG